MSGPGAQARHRGELASDAALAALLSGYRPAPGAPDEMIGPDGGLRPGWEPLLRRIAGRSQAEVQARTERGMQYLRDAGVFFRRYAQGADAAAAAALAERDWPLGPMPVLVGAQDWAAISAGLRARAALLERVMADLYGPNQLVRDGHLPAGLIAENPEWLRPMVGTEPRSGHYLHFVAFDIGRGPDGAWWVLADRTQAPSGAGFTLENRMATTRIWSDHFAQAGVHRLGGFFRAFQARLLALRGDGGARVGILTPGQMNDTYYEHAYIARYLGFMLVEGEDLVVEQGRLMVRTVAGLSPVEVLWRRLDSGWADPLELNETSRLGTPGLLGAVRAGTVTLVNALGSGVLEARAMLAFMPRLAEVLTGQPPPMPNIATWWCGQPAECAHVLAQADRLTLGAAQVPGFSLDDAAGATPGAGLALRRRIEADPRAFVGQEAVTLSTTPVLEAGRLVPRPVTLRVFLARDGDCWQVMPGGLARIGGASDPRAVTLQQGGSVADVWVQAGPDEEPVRETLLAPAGAPIRRRPLGALPARAADNLYWMGRYVERAELGLRLSRAWHGRLAEAGQPDSPLLQHVAGLLAERGAAPLTAADRGRAPRLGPGIAAGILGAFDAAMRSAAQVRDRFSPDGWAALSDLARTAQRMHATVTAGDDAARATSVLLRKLSGFSGLVHENMYRFTGWRFLSIGRSLERASGMSWLLADLLAEAAPEGALDLAIEVGDSVISHRRRYDVATSRGTVVDLLVLDGLNPRAVMHQLEQLGGHLGALPGAEAHRPPTPPQRALLMAEALLSAGEAATMTPEVLRELGGQMGQLSDMLTRTYLS